jgi:hypothetical protein
MNFVAEHFPTAILWCVCLARTLLSMHSSLCYCKRRFRRIYPPAGCVPRQETDRKDTVISLLPVKRRFTSLKADGPQWCRLCIVNVEEGCGRPIIMARLLGDGTSWTSLGGRVETDDPSDSRTYLLPHDVYSTSVVHT